MSNADNYVQAESLFLIRINGDRTYDVKKMSDNRMYV